MRLALTLLFVSLLVFPAFGITHDRDHDCDWDDDGFLKDCDVDWCEDTNTLIIEYEDDEDQVVKITKKYELFVNDEKVKLDRKQKGLVKDYYKHMKKLHVMVDEIGEEAARIGEWGGKVAAEAIRKVCERILDDDEDKIEELERAIEAEVEEIERAAEKIEAKAEKLEVVAKNLKNLHYEMKGAVPELEELEWF
jgi:chromosome segregation ATPase